MSLRPTRYCGDGDITCELRQAIKVAKCVLIALWAQICFVQ